MSEPIEQTWRVDPMTMGAAESRGRSIGRFVVLEALGQGAMGIVLGAYDPDLDRKVALKILRPGATPEAIERLSREARAMAKLSHPNVLAIHEVGVIDGGIFLATELATGGNLHAWRLAEPRSWPVVLEKYLQAGRGLAAAHAAGLVHRDFKPANVLLDKSGNARVADFGLVTQGPSAGAKPPVDDTDDVSLTTTGMLLGTPAYMAPEQHGGHGEVGPAADQFSFCVSLWEALHGAAPFEGTTLLTIAANVRANRVVEPAESTVPGWLRAVLRRGLAVDPAERWPSMDALLAELARDPAAARRRQLRWGAGVVAVGVLIGVVYLASRSSPERRCEDMERRLAGTWDAPRIAAVRGSFERAGRADAADVFERFAKQLDGYTTRWVDARRAACEATHVHGDQSTELLDLKVACLDRRLVGVDALLDVFATPPSGDALDRAVSAAQALAPLEACADTDGLRAAIPPPGDPATRDRVATIRQQVAAAKALAETGKYQQGRATANAAVIEALRTGYAPVMAEALHRRGTLERLEGDGKAAELTYEAALPIAAAARDDVLVAEIWTEQIYVVGQMLARPADALKMKTAAMVALRRANDDPTTEGNLIANLGRVLIADSKWAEAQAQLEQALAIKERIRGRDSTDVGRVVLSLGITHLEQGNYDRALAHYQRALDIFEASYGPNHPDVAGALSNLATAHEAIGELDKSRAGYQRVLSMVVRSLGPDHPRVADTHQNLGTIARSQHRFDEARTHFERAIEIQTAKLGSDHPELAQNLGNLGQIYLDLGKLELARPQLERAIAIYEAADMSTSSEIGYPLVALAETLHGLGKLDDARRIAERAVTLREAEGGRPENLAYARMVLATSLLAANRERARALDLLTKARAVFVTLSSPAGAEYLGLVDTVLAKHKSP